MVSLYFWMAVLLWLPLLAHGTKAVAVSPCQEDALLSTSAQAWVVMLPCGTPAYPGS